MDLISVIMPTYNAARWVTSTIDSLAAQTYSHFELILVDDGSQDDTVSVARSKLAADFRHPWQVIELAHNRGPSAARNVALKAAKGSWIQCLDSDDFLAPSKFELQAARCAQVAADVAAVHSPWTQCYIDDGRVVHFGPTFHPDMERRAPIMCLVDIDRVLQGSALTRRSVLERLGGWDETLRFWECEELTFRIAKAGRLESVPSALPLYFWRQHRGKCYIGDVRARYQTTTVALTWIDLIVKSLDHKTLKEAGLSLEDRKDILTSTSYWARELYRADRTAFRSYLAKARQLDPNLLPAYPTLISAIARHIGYEGAEAIVDVVRRPVDFLRGLRQALRPRVPADE